MDMSELDRKIAEQNARLESRPEPHDAAIKEDLQKLDEPFPTEAPVVVPPTPQKGIPVGVYLASGVAELFVRTVEMILMARCFPQPIFRAARAAGQILNEAAADARRLQQAAQENQQPDADQPAGGEPQGGATVPSLRLVEPEAQGVSDADDLC